LCPECREPHSPTEAELARIGLYASHTEKQIYRAKGCRACRNSGYRGRVAIQELMVVDDEIRALVMANSDGATLRRHCTSLGMKLLRQDGAERILAGETTIEELLRQTQEEVV
jgi:general secretion pathway protein E